ncbi:MAG: hypothetical protein NPIRA06_26440 [Nitrospirales bacterium]|nr:MAG: hypothetical protein NPIRA06_26440 [Nitrospirales bacterium]
MDPISSIPPVAPGESPSLPPKITVLSSPDGNSNLSAIATNPAKNEGLLPSTPTPEVFSYLERMSQIPDVRQARIAHIQQAIDSQTYVIFAEKLADSLIQELPPPPQETRPPTTS